MFFEIRVRKERGRGQGTKGEDDLTMDIEGKRNPNTDLSLMWLSALSITWFGSGGDALPFNPFPPSAFVVHREPKEDEKKKVNINETHQSPG